MIKNNLCYDLEDACVSDKIEEWQNIKNKETDQDGSKMKKNNLYDHNVYQKQEFKVSLIITRLNPD